MMRRPKLTELPLQEQSIRTFGGYCQRSAVPMGQFYDMENMTADEYPVLAPRKPRGMVASALDRAPEAMHGTDVLWSLRTTAGGATQLFRGDKAIDVDGKTVGTPYELLPWARKFAYTYNAQEERLVCCPVGDIDGNGHVEANDWLLGLQAATGKITLSEAQQQRADVDGNGKVTANDALLIGQIFSQKIDPPAPKNGEHFEMLLTGDGWGSAEAEVSIQYNGNNYSVVDKSGTPVRYETLSDRALYTYDEDNHRFVFETGRGVLRRSVVSMGSYLVIFPDKVAYNTIFSDPNATASQREGQKPWIRLENDTIAQSVTVTPCLLIKDVFTGFKDAGVIAQVEAPTEPTDGMYWLDTGNNLLKQYNQSSKQWVSVPTTYIRIDAEGIGKGFQQYDGITISGVGLDNVDGDTIIWECGDNYIVVPGLIGKDANANDAVIIQRKVPDMEYVVEYGNRLWGCSSDNHEIYCCKLGDPTNWNCFMGLASDSYAVTVGSPGAFTGAAAIGGYVLFFKENAIHRVYGTKPANFQLTTINAPGIQDGCAASAVAVDEVLYYKGVRGIYATTGNMPGILSEDLGPTLYTDAVGGRWDGRYVVSMRVAEDAADGGYHLFVYDPKTTLWHRQDHTRFLCCAAVGEDLYYAVQCIDDVDEKNATLTVDYAIMTMGGSLGYAPRTPATSNAEKEETVSWYVETGDVEAATLDHMMLTQIRLRMMLEWGSRVTVKLRYDDDRIWQEVWTGAPKSRQIITLPLIPRRCGKLRMRIEGIGDCRIYAMTLIMEQGSELRGGL